MGVVAALSRYILWLMVSVFIVLKKYQESAAISFMISDASASAAKALQLLYPEHVPLSTADLSEDEQANQQFEQLIQARNQLDKHQEQFDLLKHQLQAKMQHRMVCFHAYRCN